MEIKSQNVIMPHMSRKWWKIPLVCLVVVIMTYSIILQSAVQEWAGFHLSVWYTRLQTWLHPPEKVSFSSGSEHSPAFAALKITSIPFTDPTLPGNSLPATYTIFGGKYFSQHNRWNYCGPANLAMLLSYWGRLETHDDIAHALKPFNKDKNVMPYEMLDYVQSVNMDALVRVGGDIEILKRLIANGYPVMVEKGTHFRNVIQNKMTWMGHYQVLNGYDDFKRVFTAQDSYIQPDYEQPYDKLIEEWRSFNYTYIVVFPTEKKNDVLNLLGADADETINFQRALQKAADETNQLSGVDLFFTFYNYGTNLVSLRDYGGAAKAYDTAFALYDNLPEDLSLRPYRILWYQTGPFFAYYYTSRYADVIEKATKNSIEMVRDDIPALEESYYWRGLAKNEIGDRSGAIDDFYTCLKYHPGFEPCLKELNEEEIYP